MPVVAEPERHDWKKVIAEIEAAGITTHKLATMLHRQYNQVARWKNGSEPKHYEGEMLLIIHREYVEVKEPV